MQIEACFVPVARVLKQIAIALKGLSQTVDTQVANVTACDSRVQVQYVASIYIAIGSCSIRCPGSYI